MFRIVHLYFCTPIRNILMLVSSTSIKKHFYTRTVSPTRNRKRDWFIYSCTNFKFVHELKIPKTRDIINRPIGMLYRRLIFRIVNGKSGGFIGSVQQIKGTRTRSAQLPLISRGRPKRPASRAFQKNPRCTSAFADQQSSRSPRKLGRIR